VLHALMEDRVSEAVAGVVLRGVDGISSDHVRGQLLIRLVDAGGLTDGTRAQFEEALRQISSDHTRGRVENAIR
jgi:hypothetical protein